LEIISTPENMTDNMINFLLYTDRQIRAILSKNEEQEDIQIENMDELDYIQDILDNTPVTGDEKIELDETMKILQKTIDYANNNLILTDYHIQMINLRKSNILHATTLINVVRNRASKPGFVFEKEDLEGLDDLPVSLIFLNFLGNQQEFTLSDYVINNIQSCYKDYHEQEIAKMFYEPRDLDPNAMFLLGPLEQYQLSSLYYILVDSLEQPLITFKDALDAMNHIFKVTFCEDGDKKYVRSLVLEKIPECKTILLSNSEYNISENPNASDYFYALQIFADKITSFYSINEYYLILKYVYNTMLSHIILSQTVFEGNTTYKDYTLEGYEEDASSSIFYNFNTRYKLLQDMNIYRNTRIGKEPVALTDCILKMVISIHYFLREKYNSEIPVDFINKVIVEIDNVLELGTIDSQVLKRFKIYRKQLNSLKN